MIILMKDVVHTGLTVNKMSRATQYIRIKD
ncbi:hypothetical protein SEQU_09835 [Staphylococcus equorum UMC-CNS-924]|nr:hypothetical protein SEQU_09835 [Staphylococcus equorum UMC-CNS-924]